ncbi:DUF6668 family protein [Cellulomonas sp.]|uniref:DUF6668 family protein n=1 Tax=Cellulomonas sp. TaxID=40001 RepID=UPI001AFE061E|nr:DUF6668 family protein [Cellulomonas sp.]MBO9553824.1 hypothetical protein [Cellulomonas sp.]
MSETANPWVSRASAPDTATRAVTRVVVPTTGPIGPQQGVPLPDPDDQLPLLRFAAPASVWWVGAHGGAGETTLSSLVPGWRGTGHAWPVVPTAGSAPRAVVVARTHVRGLRAAQAAAAHWASGRIQPLDLLGLVLVADAPGRLPKPLRELAQLVGGGFPRVWSVPWTESWRLGETPTLDSAPREVTRLARDLRSLADPGATGTII